MRGLAVSNIMNASIHFRNHPAFRFCHRFNALAACLAIGIATASARDPGTGDRLLEKSREVEEQVSGFFHDTWNRVWNSDDSVGPRGRALTNMSTNLRERDDAYLLRLHLPRHDVSQASVELGGDGTLRVRVPASGEAGAYEQNLALPAAAKDGKPQVEKQAARHLMIVIVPKAPGAETVAGAPSAPAATPATPLSAPDADWDRRMLERMRIMRRDMDRMMDRAYEELRDMPGARRFSGSQCYASSTELGEENGRFVVRCYIPESLAEQAKVTIEGRLLRIESTGTVATGSAAAHMAKAARHIEWITLPESVDAARMTVERKQGMLLITVPKADGA